MKHPHADNMRLYWEDAMETDKPWERWSFRDKEIYKHWIPCKQTPQWNVNHEYRRKPVPILTPEQIAEGWIEWNGGPCPVEPESRPTYLMRDGSVSKVLLAADNLRWAHVGDDVDIIAYRPDPYGKFRQALADGKRVEWKYEGKGTLWTNCSKIDADPEYEYRIVETVPLGPEDVPPGSVVRNPSWDGCYAMAGAVTKDSVHYIMSGATSVTFSQLFEERWQINRSIPLTGKWDPNAWEPCSKEVAV